MICSIIGNEKLDAFQPYPLSRFQPFQLEKGLCSVQNAASISLDSSLGMLGMTLFTFCAINIRKPQQKLLKMNVADTFSPFNVLHMLKTLRTGISIPTPGNRQILQI